MTQLPTITGLQIGDPSNSIRGSPLAGLGTAWNGSILWFASMFPIADVARMHHNRTQVSLGLEVRIDSESALGTCRQPNKS